MSGWRAKTGASLPPSPLSRVDRRSFPAGLLAERFGEPFFELAGAGGEPQGALVGGEEVGLQGRAGDGRAGGCGGGRGGAPGRGVPVPAGGAASRAWIFSSRSRCR